MAQQLLVKKFFDEMSGLDCDEMTVLWTNDCIVCLFIIYFQLENQLLHLLLKKFFDWMCSLDCDKMTDLWPNDWGILSFYYILLIRISNVTTFVKD